MHIAHLTGQHPAQPNIPLHLSVPITEEAGPRWGLLFKMHVTPFRLSRGIDHRFLSMRTHALAHFLLVACSAVHTIGDIHGSALAGVPNNKWSLPLHIERVLWHCLPVYLA